MVLFCNQTNYILRFHIFLGVSMDVSKQFLVIKFLKFLRISFDVVANITSISGIKMDDLDYFKLLLIHELEIGLQRPPNIFPNVGKDLLLGSPILVSSEASKIYFLKKVFYISGPKLSKEFLLKIF